MRKSKFMAAIAAAALNRGQFVPDEVIVDDRRTEESHRSGSDYQNIYFTDGSCMVFFEGLYRPTGPNGEDLAESLDSLSNELQQLTGVGFDLQFRGEHWFVCGIPSPSANPHDAILTAIGYILVNRWTPEEVQAVFAKQAA